MGDKSTFEPVLACTDCDGKFNPGNNRLQHKSHNTKGLKYRMFNNPFSPFLCVNAPSFWKESTVERRSVLCIIPFSLM